jgi:hypothetical protein
MLELKAEGEEKGEDEFDKRLAVVKELTVGHFIVEIDGDGVVVAGLAGRVSHGSPSGQMVSTADDPKWRNTCTIARGSRRRGLPPLNPMECGKSSRCEFPSCFSLPILIPLNLLKLITYTSTLIHVAQ